eukprot:539246-Amphidinium_carterae.1
MQSSDQAPIDDSWIDELEKEEEQKNKSTTQSKGAKTTKSKAGAAKKGSVGHESRSPVKLADSSSKVLSGDGEEVGIEEIEQVEEDLLVDEIEPPNPEQESILFDSDRLLSEVMHGIFLLTEGDSSLTSAEVQEADSAQAGGQKRRRNKRGQKKELKKEQPP